MTRKAKITVTVLLIIAVSIAIGFIYDAIMNAFESKEYPKKHELIVAAASKKYGVPEEIIYAVIKTESDFDKGAESDAGACGLMQLMPETFTDMTGIRNPSKTVMKDASSNINAGTKYLAYLYERYENWNTAFAAYNAGLGNVDKWLDDARYSSDGITLDDIPFTETRNYVRRVNTALDAYKRLY